MNDSLPTPDSLEALHFEWLEAEHDTPDLAVVLAAYGRQPHDFRRERVMTSAHMREEPICCEEPMVHNSGSGQFECADAYFALLDEGVIWGYDPPSLRSPENVSVEHRAIFEHWLASMRPDGWSDAA